MSDAWAGPTMNIAMRHRIGVLDLDVAFRLDRPWTVLFAPSGAGKTTVLRVIAGLERPVWGRIECRSTRPSIQFRNNDASGVLVDTDRAVWMPAHERQVRLVGQQPALFPHQTVRRNVGWGINFLDTPGEHDRFCMEMLERCGAGHLAERMPGQLSGGEQQRIALARAFATFGGRALLLDEPFSALDGAARSELLRVTREWGAKNKTPVLHVTHDVGEVFEAGGWVIRMEGGKVVAEGAARDVLGLERARLMEQLNAAVLPDGPATRGAVTS